MVGLNATSLLLALVQHAGSQLSQPGGHGQATRLPVGRTVWQMDNGHAVVNEQPLRPHRPDRVLAVVRSNATGAVDESMGDFGVSFRPRHFGKGSASAVSKLAQGVTEASRLSTINVRQEFSVVWDPFPGSVRRLNGDQATRKTTEPAINARTTEWRTRIEPAPTASTGTTTTTTTRTPLPRTFTTTLPGTFTRALQKTFTTPLPETFTRALPQTFTTTLPKTFTTTLPKTIRTTRPTTARRTVPSSTRSSAPIPNKASFAKPKAPKSVNGFKTVPIESMPKGAAEQRNAFAIMAELQRGSNLLAQSPLASIETTRSPEASILDTLPQVPHSLMEAMKQATLVNAEQENDPVRSVLVGQPLAGNFLPTEWHALDSQFLDSISGEDSTSTPGVLHVIHNVLRALAARRQKNAIAMHFSSPRAADAVAAAMADSVMHVSLAAADGRDWLDFGRPLARDMGVAHKLLTIFNRSLHTAIHEHMLAGGQGAYDLCFIDPETAVHSLMHYEQCLQLVRPGGLILIDNSRLRSGAIDSANADGRTVLMRQLVDRVMHDTTRCHIQLERKENLRRSTREVTASLLDLDDGLLFAQKKELELEEDGDDEFASESR